MVGLRVENISTDRLVHYRGWGKLAIEEPALIDDRGNEYMAETFGFSDIRGQVLLESIRPGAHLDDLLVFQRPIQGIAWLRLELPNQATSGPDIGPVRFQIPARMIRR